MNQETGKQEKDHCNQSWFIETVSDQPQTESSEGEKRINKYNKRRYDVRNESEDIPSDLTDIQG